MDRFEEDRSGNGKKSKGKCNKVSEGLRYVRQGTLLCLNGGVRLFLKELDFR